MPFAASVCSDIIPLVFIAPARPSTEFVESIEFVEFVEFVEWIERLLEIDRDL